MLSTKCESKSDAKQEKTIIVKSVDNKHVSIIISNACSEANHSEEMISRIRHRLERLPLIRLSLHLEGGGYNGFSEWKDQNNLL